MSLPSTLVRAAVPGDVGALVALGERLHGEGAYRFLPFDHAKVRRRTLDYIAHPDRRCLLVADRGGAITGMLGGYLGDYLFCDELLAFDAFLFVEPRERGSPTAARLVRAFRAWARERGAREVCLGISSGINTDRVGRFYERLGFSRVGALYKQRLD